MSDMPSRTAVMTKSMMDLKEDIYSPMSMMGEMDVTPSTAQFFVFGNDHHLYGPVNLDNLKHWAHQGLVESDSWIFDVENQAWVHARQIAGLKTSLTLQNTFSEDSVLDMPLSQLRKIRLFGTMDDFELQELRKILRKVSYPPLRSVVHRGDLGNAMFILFKGEACVYTYTDGMRKVLASLTEGDFFGENTIIEKAIRSFYVDTSTDCEFLHLNHRGFQQLTQQNPDIAARFLGVIVRHLGIASGATSGRLIQKSFVEGSLSKSGTIVVPPVKNIQQA